MASKYNTINMDSDEIIEMFCELCKKKGKYRSADGFCVDCVRYFCEDCLVYHMEFLPDHIHKDKSNMPQDVCLNPCPTHRENIIKFYCQSCNKFFCSECKINDHKLCKNVHHLPELVTDLEQGTEFLALKQNFEEVDEESKRQDSVLSEAKQSLETKCTKISSEIDVLRDQLIELINNAIETIKTDLKSVENAEMTKIRDNFSKLSSVISETYSMKSTMEQKIREGKRCELFMAMKDMQIKQKVLQEDMLKIKRYQLREFELDIKDDISSLMNSGMSLGSIAFKKKKDAKRRKTEPTQMPTHEVEVLEVEVPEVDQQKSFVANQLQKPLNKGDTWYIIDIKWFKQWKSYVGYEDWDHFNVGEESANPGPIDNTPILQEGTETLKEHLIDDLDYVLVPEECWEKLLAWYGLVNGQTPLARWVIEEGVYSKSIKVEVYLWQLKLCENSNLDYTISKTFSRSDTVGKLEDVMRRKFRIFYDTEVRLWSRYMTTMYEQLNEKDKTLQKAGLYQGQVILIEQKNSDGTWPREKEKKSDQQLSNS